MPRNFFFVSPVTAPVTGRSFGDYRLVSHLQVFAHGEMQCLSLRRIGWNVLGQINDERHGITDHHRRGYEQPVWAPAWAPVVELERPRALARALVGGMGAGIGAASQFYPAFGL